jgi:small conductance mechanosensitive channel
MIDIFKSWLLGIASNTFYKVIPFLIILIVGVVVIRIVMTIVNKALAKSKMEKAAAGLIRSVLRTVLYLLLGLMAASKLGFDVTGIIALASVLTLAVSLSVQDLLTNLIGGFTLLYTKPFRSGDFVEIAGLCGTVEEIGMTYTKLITPDNKVVSIPDRSVVAADITNFSATGTRRVDLSVSASYDAPTKKVLTALLEAAKVEGVMADPAPFAAVDKYGDSAISYVLRVWCKQEDYWTVYFTVNEKIRQSFADNGVAMTYAHLNVHLDK